VCASTAVPRRGSAWLRAVLRLLALLVVPLAIRPAPARDEGPSYAEDLAFLLEELLAKGFPKGAVPYEPPRGP